MAENIKGAARGKTIAVGLDMVYWTSPDSYLVALDARTWASRAGKPRRKPAEPRRARSTRGTKLSPGARAVVSTKIALSTRTTRSQAAEL